MTVLRTRKFADPDANRGFPARPEHRLPRRRYSPERAWAPLSDDEWAVLAPFVLRSAEAAGPGRPVRDPRGRLDAVFWLAANARPGRAPPPWAALPPRFGKPDTASRHFRRLADAGLWERLLRALDRPDAPPALRALEHWVCAACRRATSVWRRAASRSAAPCRRAASTSSFLACSAAASFSAAPASRRSASARAAANFSSAAAMALAIPARAASASDFALAAIPF